MSGQLFFIFAAVLNAVSVLLFIAAMRAERRIERIRRETGLRRTTAGPRSFPW